MPGDGQGGIAEPNWEGDCSVITLDNFLTKEILIKLTYLLFLQTNMELAVQSTHCCDN
jgi:hypothetical protein